MNDLVVAAEGPSGTAGAGIVDSCTSLIKDLDGDAQAWAIGVDILAVSLDVLGMVLNPLGELIKAGLTWLMEHLAFLREPLEMLTGDPGQIRALSATWDNIATELREAADDYQGSLSGITWSGDAAAAYQAAAQDYVAGLSATAAQARYTSGALTGAGILVAVERAFVFDIIATFVSRVIAEAILAAAAAGFTFGSSLVAFTASVTAEAGVLFGKIASRIAKLLKQVSQLVRRLRLAGGNSRQVANTLMHKANKLRRHGQKQGYDGRKFKREHAPDNAFTRYLERVGDSPLQYANAATLKAAKEGANAAREAAQDRTDDPG